MMFMMPMPPTRSETAAMPAKRKEKVRVVSSNVARSVDWLRMLKSLCSAGAQPVVAAQHRVDLGERLVHLPLGDGLRRRSARTRSVPITRNCAVESGM